MRKKVKIAINKFLGTAFGFTISKVHPRTPYDIRDEFADVYKKFKPYTVTGPEAMYALFKSIEYIVANEVSGDIVECGVWRGGSMMLAGSTLLQCGEHERMLYLFDTFEGMPEPTGRDYILKENKAAHIHWGETNGSWFVATEEEVFKNFAKGTNYPHYLLVKGKVEETIPENAPEEIALLRLDLDLYEPTKHSLRHLYPRVQKGGVVIFDNYGNWSGERDAVNEYFAEIKKSPLLLRITEGMRIMIKV